MLNINIKNIYIKKKDGETKIFASHAQICLIDVADILSKKILKRKKRKKKEEKTANLAANNQNQCTFS